MAGGYERSIIETKITYTLLEACEYMRLHNQSDRRNERVNWVDIRNGKSVTIGSNT